MRRRAEYADRFEAGRALAELLSKRHLDKPVILALPRGGVPVAFEVARALNAPLDLVFVRKIGVPRIPELAAAAVVDGGEPELVINEDVLDETGMTRRDIERRMATELAEIDRRRKVYLAARSPVPLTGRSLVIVDDGLATGASMKAAVIALRRKAPKEIIVAVPVAPADTVREFESIADVIVCPLKPHPFHAIGAHYGDFHQLDDSEVVDLLDRASTFAVE